MVCGHLTHETGIEHVPFLFSHAVTNVHIYDRHFTKLKEMIQDIESHQALLESQPILSIDGHKNFYDYKVEDFELSNMNIISKVSDFDIAI